MRMPWFVCTVLTLVAAPLTAVGGEQDQTPRPVVDAFLSALHQRNFAAVEQLYAFDARFEDPGVGLAVSGGAAIARQFSEGYAIVDAFHWRVDGGFATGSWVVLHGELSSRLNGDRIGRPGQRPAGEQRFVMALQVTGGRIVRHLDFLDYDIWDERNPTVKVPVARRQEPRAELLALADRFTDALNRWPPDVDDAMSLYADDLVFEDPTFGLRQEGKARFRAAVADLWAKTGNVEARTVVEDRIASGAFLILRGRYSQKRTPRSASADRVSMAFVTAFEVRGGRIARHWDFFDKDAFDRGMRGGGIPD